MFSRSSSRVFFYTLFSIIIAYYVAALGHEYGHSTTAWLLGYKKSLFDIYHKNFYLVLDEAVDYDSILASGRGRDAALIGISGITMSTLLFLISLFSLNIKWVMRRTFWLSFFYWLADIDLMVMFQYIPNNTFTKGGDIGRFLHGLNISPLVIFIPGTLLVLLAFYRFYYYETIKIYALLPIKTNIMRRIFLFSTFWLQILLLIYWSPPVSYKIIAWSSQIFSILFILFILISCDSSRAWVKRRIEKWQY